MSPKIITGRKYLEDSSLQIPITTGGDVMYDPPSYLWAMAIAGIIAILTATCVVLYGGAIRAGLGRRRAALRGGGAAAALGGRGPAAGAAGRRGRGRRARRLVHGQCGDRGSRLVPHAARPRSAVDVGRSGRLPGLAAGAAPDPGGGAGPDRAGHA